MISLRSLSTFDDWISVNKSQLFKLDRHLFLQLTYGITNWLVHKNKHQEQNWKCHWLLHAYDVNFQLEVLFSKLGFAIASLVYPNVSNHTWMGREIFPYGLSIFKRKLALPFKGNNDSSLYAIDVTSHNWIYATDCVILSMFKSRVPHFPPETNFIFNIFFSVTAKSWRSGK